MRRTHTEKLRRREKEDPPPTRPGRRTVVAARRLEVRRTRLRWPGNRSGIQSHRYTTPFPTSRDSYRRQHASSHGSTVPSSAGRAGVPRTRRTGHPAASTWCGLLLEVEPVRISRVKPPVLDEQASDLPVRLVCGLAFERIFVTKGSYRQILRIPVPETGPACRRAGLAAVSRSACRLTRHSHDRRERRGRFVAPPWRRAALVLPSVRRDA